RFLTGCVRDRNAKVSGHVRHGGRSRRNRIQTGFDEVARGVLYASIVNVVLDGVDELDVAESAIDLADLTGNAFIAFGAEAYRPLHAGALADAVLPIGAHLGEVIGPDEAGARTIGAMHDHDGLVGQ